VPAASAVLQARAAYVSVQPSLNHDLAPSAGDARIRVDRCPTTYFRGRHSYLDRQGATGEEAGAGCCKASTAPAISSAVAQTADGLVGPASGMPSCPDDHVG
jgi:hypothetical protein